jgi:hypothetical protein
VISKVQVLNWETKKKFIRCNWFSTPPDSSTFKWKIQITHQLKRSWVFTLTSWSERYNFPIVFHFCNQCLKKWVKLFWFKITSAYRFLILSN